MMTADHSVNPIARALCRKIPLKTSRRGTAAETIARSEYRIFGGSVEWQMALKPAGPAAVDMFRCGD